MVLFAYVCAALVAPILMILHTTVTEGLSRLLILSEHMLVYAFLGLIAAIYALPLAIPVIIASELQGRGDWRVFLVGGLVLGIAMVILFADMPINWSGLAASATLLPFVLACVMTYWAIAWKWLPPKASRLSRAE